MKVLSLFTGIGAFEKALKNIGIDYELIGFSEIDKYAIKSYCAIHNVSEEKNLGDKILFIQSSCEKFVKKNKLGNLVLLDPPRGGAKEVVKYINPKDTSIVIYISCALPTFERDLKELLSKGYKISSFSILDMFPNTYHVEMVGVLEII